MPFASTLSSNGTTMLTYVAPANGRSNAAALSAISLLPTASYIRSKLQIETTQTNVLMTNFHVFCTRFRQPASVNGATPLPTREW